MRLKNGEMKYHTCVLFSSIKVRALHGRRTVKLSMEHGGEPTVVKGLRDSWKTSIIA